MGAIPAARLYHTKYRELPPPPPPGKHKRKKTRLTFAVLKSVGFQIMCMEDHLY